MTQLEFQCICVPCLLKATSPFNSYWSLCEKALISMHLLSLSAEGFFAFAFNWDLHETALIQARKAIASNLKLLHKGFNSNLQAK